MKRTVLFAAVLSAGLLSAAPAALATTAPPTATTPSKTTTAPPATTTTDDHAGNPKAFIRVLPAAAHSGSRVIVRVGCEAPYISALTSPVLTVGALHQAGPQDDPAKAPISQASATVKNVKPGSYPVTFECGGAVIRTKFTVLADAPKQVAKVPAGAPQTGDGSLAG